MSRGTKEGRLTSGNALRILKIDDIGFDMSYQRNVVPKHKRIVSEFDSDALGIPVVAERADGSLWCVDGRQRLTALHKLGKKECRCEVFASRGSAHEAAVFRKINKNRTALSSHEIYAALLEEGDPDAVRLKEIATEEGFFIPKNRPSGGLIRNSERTLQNIYAVMRLYGILSAKQRGGGETAVRFILQVCRDAFPADPDRLKTEIIEGIYTFWLNSKRGESIDQKRLVDRLGTTTVSKMIYSANMGIGTRQANMSEVITRLYRKRYRNRG